jgi:hypothetical protein
VAFPQAVWSAKGGEAAFGGNSGAGEDDEVADVSHRAELRRGAERSLWGKPGFPRLPQ